MTVLEEIEVIEQLGAAQCLRIKPSQHVLPPRELENSQPAESLQSSLMQNQHLWGSCSLRGEMMTALAYAGTLTPPGCVGTKEAMINCP